MDTMINTGIALLSFFTLEMTVAEGWLTAVNLLLGAIVFFFAFLFFFWIVQQLVANAREKKIAESRAGIVHESVLPVLGTVIADGGKPLKPGSNDTSDGAGIASSPANGPEK